MTPTWFLAGHTIVSVAIECGNRADVLSLLPAASVALRPVRK